MHCEGIAAIGGGGRGAVRQVKVFEQRVDDGDGSAGERIAIKTVGPRRRRRPVGALDHGVHHVAAVVRVLQARGDDGLHGRRGCSRNGWRIVRREESLHLGDDLRLHCALLRLNLGELRLHLGELRLHLRLRCEGRDGIRQISLRRELSSDRVVERVAKIRCSGGR